MKIQHLIQYALFGILFLLIGILLMKEPKQIFPASKERVIEKNIGQAQNKISVYNNGIQDEKKIISSMNLKLEDLYKQLNQFKSARDTFQIVEAQDTIISFLIRQGGAKDSIILLQEGIISQYEFISKSKDTLLITKDFDLKRIKRQRNLSFVGMGILTGILIFK